MRTHISLNGAWKFQPDVLGEGEDRGWFAASCDDANWQTVSVPCTFDQCAPELDAHVGPGWYRLRFKIPADLEGRRILLRFGAVNLHARVWINGTLVGEHGDGFLPFDVPIPSAVHYGGDNLLVVRVDNHRVDGEIPGTQWGWRNLGGITRDVTLEATNPLYLSAVRIAAEPTAQGGALQLQAEIENAAAATTVNLNATVRDAQGQTIYELAGTDTQLDAAGTCVINLQAEIEGARSWEPGAPHLYHVDVTLLAAGLPVDRTTQRVGFRTISTSDTDILLNGQPVFLTGFNRHEDTLESGLVRNTAAAQRDFEEMQQAGANFVRLCHYPHDEAELDLCDELGLLVMCEIPLYWWHGEATDPEASRAKLVAARRQLRKLIERDRNHPSVVFWSVANECLEDQPEVRDGQAELCRLARELDPTRLAVHVSCFFKTTAQFEDVDVICVNDYPSWITAGNVAEREAGFPSATAHWRDELAKLRERYPTKPIMVTEFGYPSLPGLDGSGLGEDAQATAILAEFAGMDAPYVCGTIVWCYADHPWPFDAPFVGTLITSPYGVITRDRRKLKAFDAIAQKFRELQ